MPVGPPNDPPMLDPFRGYIVQMFDLFGHQGTGGNASAAFVFIANGIHR